MKLHITALFSLFLLTGCLPPAEPEQFGVRESVWQTLTPEEKQLAITGYNERQLADAQLRLQQQETDAQIRLLEKEAEAKNAPLKTMIDAISQAKSDQNTVKEGIRIREMDREKITLNNGVSFKICPFIGNEFKHWMPGQRIEVKKGEFGLWDMILKNLDSGDQVEARKL